MFPRHCYGNAYNDMGTKFLHAAVNGVKRERSEKPGFNIGGGRQKNLIWEPGLTSSSVVSTSD